VLKIWKSGIAWLRTFISDDDSSSRAALRHPILMQIAHNNIKQWPVDKNGRNIKDTGELPSEIYSVNTHLVDPSYCHCIYGSLLYRFWNKYVRK